MFQAVRTVDDLTQLDGSTFRCGHGACVLGSGFSATWDDGRILACWNPEVHHYTLTFAYGYSGRAASWALYQLSKLGLEMVTVEEGGVQHVNPDDSITCSLSTSDFSMWEEDDDQEGEAIEDWNAGEAPAH